MSFFPHRELGQGSGPGLGHVLARWPILATFKAGSRCLVLNGESGTPMFESPCEESWYKAASSTRYFPHLLEGFYFEDPSVTSIQPLWRVESCPLVFEAVVTIRCQWKAEMKVLTLFPHCYPRSGWSI